MKIEVIRDHFANAYTAGKMYIDGAFFCDTIEDTDRGLKQSDGADVCKKKKIAGVTAIPVGTYNVYITFSPRFKKNLPLLNNVPAFDGVRIHSGNTAEDTEGCILVGVKSKSSGCIVRSRDTFDALFARIDNAIQSGKNVTIEIKIAK